MLIFLLSSYVSSYIKSFINIARHELEFLPLTNIYLCKCHLSSTESINERRQAINCIGVCGPYRMWLRYSSLLPSRLMYRVKSGARFARVPKAGIQSYLAQPVRRVIFAHARVADVQYVRRTGNARVHQFRRKTRGACAASATYKQA